MNFVFISPQFPECYRHFCTRLRENGVNVLAIGDGSYDELHPDLKASLTEYYRVDNMEDYDQMFRAVAWFSFKYGKIDWLESNNEYWLEQDAWLRKQFCIETGLQPKDLHKIKHKSAMKEYYKKAGLPCARYHLVDNPENCLAFAHTVGYPMVAKPDNGVGAAGNMKLLSDEDLMDLFKLNLDTQYILEEYVPGEIWAFDGITNSAGEIVFCATHCTPGSIMEIVQGHKSLGYYVFDEVPADMMDAGKRVLKSFEVHSRSFHLEFFRLTEEKEGLGKPGDIVGLEVNMRPAGGYTPDMINYAQSADYYQLWADMVCYDKAVHSYDGPHSFAIYLGRWDDIHYAHSMEDVFRRYDGRIRDGGRLQGILDGSMGNDFFIITAPDAESREEVISYVFEEVKD